MKISDAFETAYENLKAINAPLEVQQSFLRFADAACTSIKGDGNAITRVFADGSSSTINHK